LQVNSASLRGFTADVKLSVSGLPAGANAQFAPATISGGSGSATLTITTSSTTPAGVYPLVIEGISGVLSHVATVPFTVSIDSTPPVTTPLISPMPNGSGWNNSNPTITLTSTDDEPNGTGVKQITYSASGVQTFPSTIVPGASTSFAIGNEGTTTVTFFATDNAGNAEIAKTITIKLDKTPPTISGSRTPGANSNGWNNTSVTVTFQCSDSLSGLAAGSPPPPIVLAGEGANQSATGTCVDVAGNSASATVTGINIDKTPPTIACSATPNILWPPNNKLAPVNTSVNVTDSLSGPGGFNPLSATSNEPDSGAGDIQGFIPGSAITSGYLRAQRLGAGSGRIYTLTYTGLDRAGNSATCSTNVIVPHDQGQ
jgi:hypothetical protein